MMDRLALIDGDLLLHQCGFASDKKIYMVVDPEHKEVLWEGRYKKEAKRAKESIESSTGYSGLEIDSRTEPEPLEYCLHTVKQTIESIEKGVGAETHVIVLSPEEETFRYDIATIQPYKENRKELGRPYWFEEMKNYLKSKYTTHEAPDRLEADDLMAYAAKAPMITEEIEPVICSLDKDLDTVSGLHYNWRKGELYEVSEAEAMVNFYSQVLTGDRADNIPGLPGIGEIRAARLLQGCTSEPEMWRTALSAYTERGFTMDYIEEVMELLFIRRWEDNEDPTGLERYLAPRDRTGRENYW